MRVERTNTKQGEILVVDIDKAPNYIMSASGDKFISFQLLGCVEDLTEQQCAHIVDERIGINGDDERLCYRDYSNAGGVVYTAKVSMITLLKRLGVNDTWKSKRIYVNAEGKPCICSSCRSKRN